MTVFVWATAMAIQAAPVPSAPVPRPDWQVVSSAGGLTVYLDPASSRRSGDVVRIAIHSIAAEPSEGGMTAISVLMAFNCRLRTVAMVEAHAFGPGGLHLEGGQAPPEERRVRRWEGSEEEEIARRACAVQPAAR